ncbi:MAG: flagellar export protein FliJ [Deltaproteobacteria bacterium]|jgi:flagellar FliJ protein|nr:flagellar export protein FliJ [Deltaproteobacteria bacterium]
MAAFKFNLEFLITLRRRREEQAATSLAKRLSIIRELQERISSMEEIKESLQADLQRHIQNGHVTPALLSLYSDFQTKLFQDKRSAEELLALSRREEAKERAILRKAVMERQLIERYKDKKVEDWKAEDLKEEQKILEEMAALVKARKLRIENDDSKP